MFLTVLVVKEGSSVNKWGLCMTIVSDCECVFGVRECFERSPTSHIFMYAYGFGTFEYRVTSFHSPASLVLKQPW